MTPDLPIATTDSGKSATKAEWKAGQGGLGKMVVAGNLLAASRPAPERRALFF